MNLADLDQVKTRAIPILNANRGAYAATIGSGPNRNAVYPFDQELTDAALEADAMVVVEGYFQSKLALRGRFFVASGNLANGDTLPECDGLYGKVEFSIDSGATWKTSNETDSQADIDSLTENGAYINPTANTFAGYHYIDDDDGVIYTSSPETRIQVPTYARTGALQALEIHESAIIAGMIMLLYKNHSQAAFEWYQQLFLTIVGRIKNGQLDLPEVGPMPGGAAS